MMRKEERMCEVVRSCVSWERSVAIVLSAIALATGATCGLAQVLGEVTESFLQLLRMYTWARCLMTDKSVLSCTTAVEILNHCH